MEQLLVQCANAIETNNATQAQQILWVLNNTTPQEGDSNQRLAASFIRALTTRASKTSSCKMLEEQLTETPNTNSYNNLDNNNNLSIQTHKFSVIELASFVDLTPWHRFGYTAANSAILEATKGFSVIHIVDLSLTHCMQIPTLIDAIANRDDVPPSIKLTVAVRNRNSIHIPIPPLLDLSYDELGSKLVNFAKSRNVSMEFKAVSSTYADGFASLIEYLRVQVQDLVYNKTHEALVINCHMMLHYIPEETLYTNMNMNTKSSSLRSMFLEALRGLEPTIVILVDEDADLTSSDLVTRLRSAFNYLWIPFDTVDTFLPRGSKQRHWYESDVCWKIENVIAYEGVQRVERVEDKSKWEQRMRNAHFQGVCFSEDTVMEVKGMIDEHAVGWGLKKEDEFLLLTWKGHNVIFASAWLPS
ncbi:scarecrow-like protein 32, partial [Vicia villosa]|uniref:scarecrow-like protein 32 n=1 Tax=Vicia villosa TaxID=3911 RepID=UPI00273B75AE